MLSSDIGNAFWFWLSKAELGAVLPLLGWILYQGPLPAWARWLDALKRDDARRLGFSLAPEQLFRRMELERRYRARLLGLRIVLAALLGVVASGAALIVAEQLKAPDNWVYWLSIALALSTSAAAWFGSPLGYLGVTRCFPKSSRDASNVARDSRRKPRAQTTAGLLVTAECLAIDGAVANRNHDDTGLGVHFPLLIPPGTRLQLNNTTPPALWRVVHCRDEDDGFYHGLERA